jgi:acyl transferase domain-containing protein/acyl carrier protein
MSPAIPKRGEDRSALLRAYRAIQDLEARLERAEQTRREPVALVGLGCRFPGADNPDAFWQMLSQGRDATGEVPPGRWDADAWFDPEPQTPGKAYTRRGGYLRDVALFDPEFFGISPREAAGMDPQQRLLLEVSWEALENAGLAPDGLTGTRAGVFVGLMNLDYPQMMLTGPDAERIDAFFGTGSEMSFPAGRLSYHLGVQGPSMVVATACSSSLVAVHLACQSLRAGECRLALAGGVNVILNPRANVVLCKMSALSPDGRCKTFDARADGYGRGEGCGIVVLKRLSDALADGDNILALIRGSAVNHGGPSGGLTVPNGLAQETVIRDALQAAGLDPARVDYIEAHGTGTSLGDPIELRALAAVLGPGRAEGDPFLVGSVKTNVGHLEAAAGIAGLIKVVLSLRHGQIPPHLHLQQPNPHVPWGELPLKVVTRPAPWPQGESPAVAGISSFGLSGVNAHVVVEEAPAPVATLPPTRPYHVLGLSARTERALRELAGRWARHLEAHAELSLADVAFTANTGRASFRHRLAVVSDDTASTRIALDAFALGRPAPGLLAGQALADRPPRVAFLFTGLGSQYVGMGRQLYETQSAFREALEECASLAGPHLEQPLLSVFYPPAGALSLLEEPLYARLTLFSLEYALTRLWLSWGVIPAAVLGHGQGEYAAACVAGVLSLEDAVRLLTRRTGLIHGLPHETATAAVLASEERVMAALAPHGDQVILTAVNGPEHVVISGNRRLVQAILTDLDRDGVAGEMLRGVQPFRVPPAEELLADFEEAAGRLDLGQPRFTVVSGVTGQVAPDDELASPAYWRRQASEPVRFADGVQALRTLGCGVFLEIGPAQALASLGRHLPGGGAWLASLRPEREDGLQVAEVLQSLWVRGVPVNWVALDAGSPRQKLPLPTYPFQRQRCWHEGLGASAASVVTPATGNPLAGRRLRSVLKEKVFESLWEPATLPLLEHHRVHDTIVAPAACFVAAVLAAAREVLGTDSCDLEGLAFSEALLPGEGRTVQIVLSPQDSGQWTFGLHSQDPRAADLEGPWTLHASGQVSAGQECPVHHEISETGLQAMFQEVLGRCQRTVPAGDFYQSLADTGIDLGPDFRWLEDVRGGESEALGRLRSPLGGEPLPPGLLDSCFQLVAACLPPEQISGQTYVPLGIDRLRHAGSATGSLWAHARLRQGEAGPAAGGPASEERSLRSDEQGGVAAHAAETLTADVLLFEESGRVVVSVEGLHLKRIAPDSLGRGSGKPEDWLYELRWETVSRPDVGPEGAAGAWLILADRGGIGQTLAGALRDRGGRCTLVFAGTEYARPGEGELEINPTDPADLDRLLAEVQEGEPALQGVIHLWGLEEREGWERSLQQGCGSTLALMQRFLRRGSPVPRLWLVTRGAQAVGGETVAPAQSALWGLARTAALEHPELDCTCIDLDPGSEASEVTGLLAEVCAPDGEDQVALRGEERLAARLTRTTLGLSGDQMFQLEQSRPGVLDSLVLTPLTRQPPGPGEVEVQVRAAGLNFRDVLGALGMYPGDPGSPGGECAGTITAIGSDVEGFAIGQEVVALAPGSFRSYLNVRTEVVALKPASLTFEEAASVPVAFLTARLALEGLARLAPGERVLIHAAAGGVGLAAVQLARRAGATILATAGSPAKRAFLHSLGIEHVFDSRSPTFADQLREVTGGQGVDVVLNSLAGEFIHRSLESLAPGGRFIEIGKTDVWEPEKVRRVRDDVTYQVFALDRLTLEEPAQIGVELSRLFDDFAAGHLQLLPRHIFPLHDAARAFRFMAQARHTGKIVLTVGPSGAAVSPDGSYLVTGGLGALGLRTARWLVEQGARHLILVSRRGPSPEVARVLAELEQSGARLLTLQADVAEEDELGKALAGLPDNWPALRGVIHAAGVLDDGVLLEQSWERFEKVLAPKVRGAWNLHQMTQGVGCSLPLVEDSERKVASDSLRGPLDFFVMFSSAASVLGSPGQGNYAAANAFLDALAHHRRALGLPALSINWGPWQGEGMAARMGERRWRDQGTDTIPPEQGVELFGRLLGSPAVQVGVLPVRWPAFLRRLGGRVPPLFRGLAPDRPARPSAQADGIPELLRRLGEAPAGSEREVLANFVSELAVRLLGSDRARNLDPRRPLQDLGLDSLTAVEFRNALGHAIGRPLPAPLLFNYPTVEALVGYLADEVLGLNRPAAGGPASEERRLRREQGGVAAHAAAASPPPSQPDGVAGEVLDEIEGISDEEVDRLLNARTSQRS